MSTDTGHHTDAADQELVPTGHPSLDDLRTIDLLAELSDEQLQEWSDAAELYEVTGRCDGLTGGRGVARDDPRLRGHAARHDPQRRPRGAAV